MTKDRNHFFTVLCAILALAVVAFNARVAATLPFGFDESFNLQVVKSLATHFAYESTYAPAVVYNPDVTTNGPLQYLAAFTYLLSRSFDTTIVIVTTISMLLLMSAMFMIRPWIAAFFAVMYPFWSTCVYAGTSFLGEIFATSAALFGILSFERARARSGARDPFFLIGCLCFGIAISTKLLLATVVAPLLFCLFIQHDKAASPLQTRLAVAASVTVRALCLIGLFFLLQFSFSVGHTTGAWFNSRTFSTLVAFLHGHLSQAQGASRQAAGIEAVQFFSNRAVFIVIALCALSLVYARPFFAIFIGAVLTLAFALGTDLDERRMLPMYLIVLVLGAREIVPCVQALWARLGRSTRASAVPAFVILGFLLLNAFVGHGIKPKFYGDPNRAFSLNGYYKSYHFHRQLIAALEKQRYVLTSGWWQFPETSIRYNLQFYDRTAPQNAGIPPSQAVLFFSTAYEALSPHTTIQGNCAAIIYREGPLVVCRPRTDVPLGYAVPVHGEP